MALFYYLYFNIYIYYWKEEWWDTNVLDEKCTRWILRENYAADIYSKHSHSAKRILAPRPIVLAFTQKVPGNRPRGDGPSCDPLLICLSHQSSAYQNVLSAASACVTRLGVPGDAERGGGRLVWVSHALLRQLILLFDLFISHFSLSLWTRSSLQYKMIIQYKRIIQ